MEAQRARAALGVWGNTLAVRIPDEIVETTGFAPGQKTEVWGQRGEIVIRRPPASPLEAMFAGKSAEEWRPPGKTRGDEPEASNSGICRRLVPVI
jgi:antitoxin component of MazEF toxin-antitoxin module